MTARILLARASDPGLLDDAVEARVSDLPFDWEISPNFSSWWPGDLLLIRSSDKGGAFLRNAQSAFSRAHAAWTHACIYCGDGAVIEATPNVGVALGSTTHYADTRDVAVMRAKMVRSPADGDRVIAAAKNLLGVPYGWTQIVQMAARWFQGLEQQPEDIQGGVVCSTLFELSIVSVFNQ